jgi:hypothetical protein
MFNETLMAPIGAERKHNLSNDPNDIAAPACVGGAA